MRQYLEIQSLRHRVNKFECNQASMNSQSQIDQQPINQSINSQASINASICKALIKSAKRASIQTPDAAGIPPIFNNSEYIKY